MRMKTNKTVKRFCLLMLSVLCLASLGKAMVSLADYEELLHGKEYFCVYDTLKEVTVHLELEVSIEMTEAEKITIYVEPGVLTEVFLLEEISMHVELEMLTEAFSLEEISMHAELETLIEAFSLEEISIHVEPDYPLVTTTMLLEEMIIHVESEHYTGQ